MASQMTPEQQARLLAALQPQMERHDEERAEMLARHAREREHLMAEHHRQNMRLCERFS